MHRFKPLTSHDLVSILGHTIQRDEVNKIIAFLAALSAFTRNSQLNISFNGPSSAGKSYIPLEVANLFPEEDVKTVGYCSPTAFFHDVGVFNKEVGGYIVDLSQKILIFLDQPHNLLLQHLRPLLSHDKRDIGMKITDKVQKAGLKTKNIILKGFPAVIFCTAGLKLDEQEATRFILLSPETTQEKLRASILQTIKKASDGKAFEKYVAENPERKLLMERIRAIRDEEIEDVRIGHADQIENGFLGSKRMLKPRHQRDIGRLIALIKIFALLNLWWREREENVLVADEADIEEGFKVWQEIGKYQELGIPPHVHQVFEEVVLPAWRENEGRGLSRQQIMERHYRVYERALPSWQLRQDILPMLETAGLIRQEQDPNDKRQLLVFPVVQKEATSPENNSELDGGAIAQQTDNLANYKSEYNAVLAELKPLEAFLDDNSIPLKEREKKQEGHKQLIAQALQLKRVIEGLGYRMNADETHNGFPQ